MAYLRGLLLGYRERTYGEYLGDVLEWKFPHPEIPQQHVFVAGVEGNAILHQTDKGTETLGPLWLRSRVLFHPRHWTHKKQTFPLHLEKMALCSVLFYSLPINWSKRVSKSARRAYSMMIRPRPFLSSMVTLSPRAL